MKRTATDDERATVLKNILDNYAEAKATGNEAECRWIERTVALWGYTIKPFDGKWQIK